jgi:hypothetical protein
MNFRFVVLLIITTSVFGQSGIWNIKLNDGLKLDSCKSLILENDILHGTASSMDYFSIHIGDIKELQYNGNWKSSFSMGGCIIGLGLGAFGYIHQLNRNSRSNRSDNTFYLVWFGLMIGGSKAFGKSPNKTYDLSELNLEEKRKLIVTILSKQ